MSSGLRETGRPGGRGLGRAQIVDVAIALAAFVAVLLLLRAHYRVENPGQRELDLLGVALAAASTLPLLAWRRAPLAVFSATTIASTLLLSEGYGPGLPVGPTVALFLLAASRDSLHPWTTRITLTVAVLFLAHLAAAALSHGQLPIVPVLFGTLGWTLAWFAGDRARLRREHLLELRERAARTEREAERERRLAAVEERMRIARDLHDSAGHAINVILVQTAAARLLQTRDSVRSRAALETIEQVARSTLADIDALVASLRDDSQNGHVQTPVGLAGIGALVASHRASGLEVSIETAGTGTALPSRVDQSAYRILQEALTNAARHGAGTARAEIAFRAQRLEITVTNPMRPGASIAPRLRHGLTGMRERAALLGGEFEAGGHGKTFVVHASLPLKRGSD